MEISEITFLSGVYAPLICAVLAFAFSKIAGELAVKSAAFFGFAAALASSVLTAFFYAENGALEVSSAFGLMGVNGVSLAMYLLAGIVGFAAFLWTIASPVKIKGISTYLVCMLFMQGGLMGMFASQNILWMYAFHEFALVPTFIAMCVWGGENRKSAAMEMAIYLTLGALLVLLGIISISFISTKTLTFN